VISVERCLTALRSKAPTSTHPAGFGYHLFRGALTPPTTPLQAVVRRYQPGPPAPPRPLARHESLGLPRRRGDGEGNREGRVLPAARSEAAGARIVGSGDGSAMHSTEATRDVRAWSSRL
jgi:hypothetical protein